MKLGEGLRPNESAKEAAISDKSFHFSLLPHFLSTARRAILHGPLGPTPPGGGGAGQNPKHNYVRKWVGGWVGVVPDNAHYPKPTLKTLTYCVNVHSARF